MLFAFSEATVPRIQLVTRKAYGGAYVVMNSKSIRADVAFAWPTAEFAVMGPEGAVNIVFRRELEKGQGSREHLVQKYRDAFANLLADTQNGRVLIYNSVPNANGARADVVLGGEFEAALVALARQISG